MGFSKSISKCKKLLVPLILALWLLLEINTRSLVVLVILIVLYSLINFVLATSRWHSSNKFDHIEGDLLPPQYPSTIPYVGNLISFTWNNANFIRRATTYGSRLTSSRILFLGFEVYIFQDRQTIANIWKQSTLSSPIYMFVYVLKYFFGIPENVLSIYRADDSGPFPKPYGDSNVPAKDRIDHITHHGFLRAFGGPGLLPTVRRYMNALTARMEEKAFSTEWTEIADLSSFFQDVVGSSLIECIYGSAMLQLNPEFMQDLWGFDSSVPWLARGVPSFVRPSAYKPRQKCVDQLKRWYSYAREHFDESNISLDGDGDPAWGSNLMRYRQEKLLAVKNHDDDALAKMDLGLAWGAVGNTIPCAMLTAFHIFKDPILLQRVRVELESSFGHQHLLDIDPNKLTKEALLSSVYAETLRFYVKTYFMVSSPHVNVNLGRWTLPKSCLGLMNAGISHMDETFWNSYNGEYPVKTFWADRFVIDPMDPHSGPVALHVRESPEWMGSRRKANEKLPTGNKPFFSMEGTEGSWFPYGGGHSICPGRFLAKSVIIFTFALLVTDYDVEILSNNLEISNWRFGLGVGGLKHSIRFKIRKRSK